MDNRWSDSLRRKMEHHGETPPEGLWDAVERELDRRAVALSRRRRTMFWSVGSSAAAAVVALLLVLDFGGTAGDPGDGVVADRVADLVVPESVVVEPVVEPVVDMPRFNDVTAVVIRNIIPEEVPEIIPEIIPEVIPEVIPGVVPNVTPVPEPSRKRPEYEQYIAAETPVTTRKRKARGRGKWQAGLYASNGAMTGSRSDMNFGRVVASNKFFDLSNSVGSESYLGSALTTPTHPSNIMVGSANRSVFNNVKHSLPVTVGVSVGHGLGERWSLTGGVTYTRLASTFRTTNGLYSGSYEQVLHYVGVPLDVKFDLWRSAGGFSVYLSAGGQAAKSVAGRVTARGAVPLGVGVSMREGSLNDPRVRWSVRGSAGVGWDFTPTVGLYAEPGVDYHFDSGSPVVTVWNERPLNFGLRLGLRLSL